MCLRRKKEMQENEPIAVTANAERYYPEDKQGLTAAQVEERQRKGLVNAAVDTEFITTKQIVINNVFTYFNLIFVVLGVLLMLVQSYKNMTFLPVVIINTVIGIYQEIKSKKVLDGLNILNATKVTVVRDGQEQEISPDELVLDDVVLFKSGEQISGDAIVLSGEVRVNESLLTGESDEITKVADSQLLSGSFIVSGSCYARIDKIGAEAYVHQLTLEAKSIKKGEQSEMVGSINRLVKWVGIIIIPIGCVLFFQSYFINHQGLHDSIVSMEAALIGMIPEGLYLLTTVALAASTMRLAKRGVLLHNMKSIESLARVDVLCVDKTGTITENTMEVQELVPVVSIENDGTDLTNVEKLIGDFCRTMSADNDTMKAMKEFFVTNNQREAVSYTSFSSVEKFSSVTFPEATYILGAPEMILRDNYEMYQSEVEHYTSQGYRLLVFGKYLGEFQETLAAEVQPLGYILLWNPIRKEAKATFEYFAEQNVAIKVISGDNPLTVSNVAQAAGIIGAENYVDARTLTTMEAQTEALEKYTVFGRVTPEQKKQFVLLLKKLDHTVAMTGDGVNDILAMKEADCSIAMASGNQATAQASQVVLLDSDFSTMPEVVFEGRQVVNNIERSSSLFLVKNIFSLLMSVFAMIFAVTYPLQPTQVTLISLFTIGIPSTFLALEPNHRRIEGKFLFNVLSKAIPGGLTDMLVVGALLICGDILALQKTDISTTATLLLVSVGFMVLYKISSPMNRYRKRVMIGCLIGMVITSISMKNLFSLTSVSPTALLLLAILFFAADSTFQHLSTISEKVQLWFYKKRH